MIRRICVRYPDFDLLRNYCTRTTYHKYLRSQVWNWESVHETSVYRKKCGICTERWTGNGPRKNNKGTRWTLSFWKWVKNSISKSQPTTITTNNEATTCSNWVRRNLRLCCLVYNVKLKRLLQDQSNVAFEDDIENGYDGIRKRTQNYRKHRNLNDREF